MPNVSLGRGRSLFHALDQCIHLRSPPNFVAPIAWQFREVGSDDPRLATGSAVVGKGEVRRARAAVEDERAGEEVYNAGRKLAPRIDRCSSVVVEEIVPPCDRGEHAASRADLSSSAAFGAISQAMVARFAGLKPPDWKRSFGIPTGCAPQARLLRPRGHLVGGKGRAIVVELLCRRQGDGLKTCPRRDRGRLSLFRIGALHSRTALP